MPSRTASSGLQPLGWALLAAGTAVVASVLAGALTGTTLPVLLGTSVTRATMDAAGIACVGAALTAVLVPVGSIGRSHRAALAARALHGQVDRILVVASTTWLLAVVLAVVFRTADAFGRSPTTVGAAEILLWTTRLGAGRGLVLTLGCAAFVLVCAVLRLRSGGERVQVRIPLVAALLGVLTPAVTGHAGTAHDHEIAVVTVALHVGAAAVWVGGLGGLVVLVRHERELLDGALPGFSTLAAYCLGCVALSGGLSALVRLDSPAALTTTGYGWLIVVKAVAVVAVGALGGLTRTRLRSGRIPVLRWAAVEVTLMAVTLGVAAALTQTGTV